MVAAIGALLLVEADDGDKCGSLKLHFGPEVIDLLGLSELLLLLSCVLLLRSVVLLLSSVVLLRLSVVLLLYVFWLWLVVVIVLFSSLLVDYWLGL